MQLHDNPPRTPALVAQLVTIWAAAVRATHTFLSPAEITAIQAYVPTALTQVPDLCVAVDDQQRPVGFMGVADHHLEMLFLDPTVRGRGLGRQLLTHGIVAYQVTSLTVNEQNPQAHGFYEHLGFRVTERHAVDEQGQPYPVLTMVLPADAGPENFD